jgi:hypothetical protein
MKTLVFAAFRLSIAILAGLLTGLFLLFSLASWLLAGQTVGYWLLNPASGVNPLQGGLKSVAVELPLVVFGLPFLDAGCWPGVLAGVIAHRLRSLRAILVAGCMGGVLYITIVFVTYSLFDPILAIGFVLLEISAGFAASQLDAWVIRFFEKTPDSVEAGDGIKKPRWIYGIYFLAAAAPLVGLKTCCTFSRSNPAAENALEDFVRAKQPGSVIDLFNGTDLSGWSVRGFGKWAVKDGVLTIRRGSGYLATCCEDFTDFILDADIRANPRGNSGIFFRAHNPPLGLRSQPVGYEAQVDRDDPRNPTGSLYKRAKASRILVRDDEWFHMTVSAIGQQIQIQVNGETVADATDADFLKGFIALQSHDPYSVISYKNIQLRIPDINSISP